MSLILKGLPQISQDGKSVWFTDKSGGYVLTTNEGGWGFPNFELNQSALLFFAYRMSNPKVLVKAVGSSVKHTTNADNDTDEFGFQGEYLKDGHYEFHSARLMVTTADVQSIDTPTPIVFSEGDIWYNRNDGNVKQRVGVDNVILDLSDPDVLDAIVANESVTATLTCDEIFYRDLAVEKQKRYQRGVKARRNQDSSQEDRMRADQTDIQNGSAAAAYQFSYGLKVEAQNTIESLLDDFNLS